MVVMMNTGSMAANEATRKAFVEPYRSLVVA
jgi:hypothetical protein